MTEAEKYRKMAEIGREAVALVRERCRASGITDDADHLTDRAGEAVPSFVATMLDEIARNFGSEATLVRRRAMS